MKQERIFLTGFMGSGKSTLGKKLAAISGKTFIDLDDHIEAQENASISRIFEERGEPAFRDLETHYLKKILEEDRNAVIALGGGTICFNNNLALVKEKGMLVYIELPAAALMDRLDKGKRNRPLLQGLSATSLLEEIGRRLEARKPFYAQAHLTLSGINLTAPVLHEAISDHAEKNNH